MLHSVIQIYKNAPFSSLFTLQSLHIMFDLGERYRTRPVSLKANQPFYHPNSGRSQGCCS
jgi:hypothetical protein